MPIGHKWQLPGFDSAVLFLALQLFIASGLALGFAKQLDLANPFWAAMPVWVVHQPFREDLLTRAALRIVGTLVGAVVSLCLIVLHPPQLVLIVCLSAFIGGCAALAFTIGTSRSYGTFMAAITMLVVVLPFLSGLPHQGAATPVALAVDRILCTILGVICVAAVTVLFTPARGSDLVRPPHGRTKWAGAKRFLLCGGATLFAAISTASIASFPVLAFGMTLVVYALIMSSAPDPRPIHRSLLPGVAIGVASGIAYHATSNFVLVHHPVLLVALTAAFLAAGALLRVHRKTQPVGLDANMCFLLVAEVGTWRHGSSDVMAGGLAMLAAASLAWLLIRQTILRDFTRESA
ncbi:FUSC family protein [Rhizobium sp. AQ_MP]|uniref:FUSC family protein n=1 Tax=Rhizobium sp. AQ_MP TaxID=2761536 RepID=UPI00163B4027|nr:FUSC family protein [Rhizobium sp. AQ_MP]MBC2775246.1 FUSC family protein [Rhizobium sp. AQ_MP]